MDESHLKDKDQRTKRRIDKDNPYRLFTVGIVSDEPHYFVQFKDGAGIEHCLEIERTLFDLFDQFELDDLSYMNEVDRHYEAFKQTETSINRRMLAPQEAPVEIVMRHFESDELHSALLKLPEIQRRRLILYYYEGLTQKQIAEIEKTSQPAIFKSISAAIEKLKKTLNIGL